MDCPEYLGSFVTLHPHPTPLASEHSSRTVPPFALFSSDRVHGWGFSGSLGKFAHLWLLLPSFHTCLLGFQRSGLKLYPLMSFSGAHSLVGISPGCAPATPASPRLRLKSSLPHNPGPQWWCTQMESCAFPGLQDLSASCTPHSCGATKPCAFLLLTVVRLLITPAATARPSLMPTCSPGPHS